MGLVEFDFHPSVPVFDANVSLGRRHDRPVRVDSVAGTLDAMKRAGVSRAVVHSPHAANFDGGEGHSVLLDSIRGYPNLVPQFVCNPSFDDLGAFSSQVAEVGVTSVRMFPILHKYPFQDWIVRPYLEWLVAEKLPLWIAADECDPAVVYDTLARHVDLRVVLCEVHYKHLVWAVPMLKRLANLNIEISRLSATDAVSEAIGALGTARVLYGSRFPDHPMLPQLYHLHRCDLSDAQLQDVCSGNLERLLNSR